MMELKEVLCKIAEIMFSFVLIDFNVVMAFESPGKNKMVCSSCYIYDIAGVYIKKRFSLFAIGYCYISRSIQYFEHSKIR